MTLQAIRENIAGLGNMQLTSDMAVKILTDRIQETPLEPRVANAFKRLIEILGTVSNPATFYGNLIQGGLEETAVAKLKALEEMKKRVDGEVQAFFERERKIQRIGQLRGKIGDLEKVVKAKQISYEGAFKEVEEWQEKGHKLESRIRKCQENIAKVDVELGKIAQLRTADRDFARKTGLTPPQVLTNSVTRQLEETRESQTQTMHKAQAELNDVRNAIFRVERYIQDIKKERDSAAEGIKALEREIASLR